MSFADLTPVANVLTQAFWNDSLLRDVILVNQHQHPEDVSRYWLHRIQMDLYDYSARFMVATIPDTDTSAAPQADKVVGITSWYRIGDDGKRKLRAAAGWWGRAWQTSMWCAVRFAIRVENWIWPNRCANPLAPDACDRDFEEHRAEIYDGPGAESWLLGAIAVDPEFQGRGIGRALIEDGLKMVDADGVSAGLISVEGLDGFYDSCGFTERILKLGGKGELEGYDGGWVMFRPAKKVT